MAESLLGLLKKPYAVVVILIVATLLSLSDRNFGYFFGLGVVLFIVWRSKWDWSVVGFGTRISRDTILHSILLTVPLFVLTSLIEPFLQHYFGAFDLSSIDDIRGDFGSYLILMAIMWVFAAFGEQLLFHGYYMKQFARLFGDSNAAWLVSAFFISVYFGISHSYQGTAGMIAVGITGIYCALIFYKHRTNLALVAFVHGFYDTIGLTLIYLNQDKVLSDWVLHLLR